MGERRGAEAYQSKTQSLRDKMKKRRQAIESLLTGDGGVGVGVGADEGGSGGVTEKKSKLEESKEKESEVSAVSMLSNICLLLMKRLELLLMI